MKHFAIIIVRDEGEVVDTLPLNEQKEDVILPIVASYKEVKFLCDKTKESGYDTLIIPTETINVVELLTEILNKDFVNIPMNNEAFVIKDRITQRLNYYMNE